MGPYYTGPLIVDWIDEHGTVHHERFTDHQEAQERYEELYNAIDRNRPVLENGRVFSPRKPDMNDN